MKKHQLMRRQLLIAAVTTALLPSEVLAGIETKKKLDWKEFKIQVSELANAYAHGSIKSETLSEKVIKILQMLDVSANDFKQGLDASYETGNRYWLWQRMIKQRNLNGGVLTIDNQQMVQLHDHPGATGIVRIISGEAEVWLFDEVKINKHELGIAQLNRVSRRILRAGDIAILTPHKGNVHALKSHSKECRMLDFFMPPYEKSQRSWFEPLTEKDRKSVV